MTLPPFAPPTIDELRRWYQRYRSDEDVRRLILEVQRGRTKLAELRTLLQKADRAARRSDFGRLNADGAPLRAACDLLYAETVRAELPAVALARKQCDASAFDIDPDEAQETARVIARGHRRQR